MSSGSLVFNCLRCKCSRWFINKIISLLIQGLHLLLTLISRKGACLLQISRKMRFHSSQALEAFSMLQTLLISEQRISYLKRSTFRLLRLRHLMIDGGALGHLNETDMYEL